MSWRMGRSLFAAALIPPAGVNLVTYTYLTLQIERQSRYLSVFAAQYLSVTQSFKFSNKFGSLIVWWSLPYV